MIQRILILLQSDLWYDRPEDVENTNAFGAYIPALSAFLIAVGAILAILAAGRIYNNWNLGETNVFKSTANLIFGMMLLVATVVFINTVF